MNTSQFEGLRGTVPNVPTSPKEWGRSSHGGARHSGRYNEPFLEGKLLSFLRAISFPPVQGSGAIPSLHLVSIRKVHFPWSSPSGLLFGIEGEAKQGDDVYHGLSQVLPKAV